MVHSFSFLNIVFLFYVSFEKNNNSYLHQSMQFLITSTEQHLIFTHSILFITSSVFFFVFGSEKYLISFHFSLLLIRAQDFTFLVIYFLITLLLLLLFFILRFRNILDFISKILLTTHQIIDRSRETPHFLHSFSRLYLVFFRFKRILKYSLPPFQFL